MKVKLGMLVEGEIDRGKVVAMTEQWCIYTGSSGTEFAEPWDCIVLVASGPAEVVSSVKESPVDVPEVEP